MAINYQANLPTGWRVTKEAWDADAQCNVSGLTHEPPDEDGSDYCQAWVFDRTLAHIIAGLLNGFAAAKQART